MIEITRSVDPKGVERIHYGIPPEKLRGTTYLLCVGDGVIVIRPCGSADGLVSVNAGIKLLVEVNRED